MRSHPGATPRKCRGFPSKGPWSETHLFLVARPFEDVEDLLPSGTTHLKASHPSHILLRIEPTAEESALVVVFSSFIFACPSVRGQQHHGKPRRADLFHIARCRLRHSHPTPSQRVPFCRSRVSRRRSAPAQSR